MSAKSQSLMTAETTIIQRNELNPSLSSNLAAIHLFREKRARRHTNSDPRPVYNTQCNNAMPPPPSLWPVYDGLYCRHKFYWLYYSRVILPKGEAAPASERSRAVIPPAPRSSAAIRRFDLGRSGASDRREGRRSCRKMTRRAEGERQRRRRRRRWM